MSGKQRFLDFWEHIDSLDDKIYYSINTIGCFAIILAFFMGCVQGLSTAATVTTLLCCLWMLALLIIGICRPKSLPYCRFILVCGLNFIMLPPAYFFCGGLTSGMILFYLLSLFLTAVLLHGRVRIVTFTLSLLFLAYSLHFGYYHPDLIIPLTPRQEYEDVLMTFCTTGIALGSMTIFILNAYNSERKRSQMLLEQLSDLSIRDPLSGLYNRRELFRRLDLLYQLPEERSEKLRRDDCYIAMFDIDNFKMLNDTYGHQFGDTVLSAVAQKLSEAVYPEHGEFAARYGGEEFVYMFYAESMSAAFHRADAVCAAISQSTWPQYPNLTVTISGGLVSCEKYDELDAAMRDVDAFLYQAKHAGKNQIVTQEQP